MSSLDVHTGLEKSVEDLATEIPSSPNDSNSPNGYVQTIDTPIQVEKSFWDKLFPVIACGAGLFSDGYINNVIGSVSTILTRLYGTRYTESSARKNVSAIAFAGTVLGQLIFGYTSDKWSRNNSLFLSTIILIVFAILSAGSYGAGGNLQGMFMALTAYRFLVGIGIGGEYPAGSVACSEASSELKSGSRNRWFIIFTNVMIDGGFVFGAFVPYILVKIFTENHLRAIWRISLALGALPPIILLLLRHRLHEPEKFQKESMKYVKIPYGLVLKYYGLRLFVVSLIWFIYDFSAYSFGIYSSTILANVLPENAPMSTTFGWNTLINVFYLPGAIAGSFFADLVGPRNALAIGVTAQGIVGFIMAALYSILKQPHMVPAFTVVFGLFMSLGEFGPGDNIGLIASKTCATGVRGQYYSVAAAVGKLGAFVGTYVFPYIIKAGGEGDGSAKLPFYISSSLCVGSGILAYLALPHIGQDTIAEEDIKFRAYLEEKGWDVSQLGTQKNEMGDDRGVVTGSETAQNK